jgi:hypothetical protein
MPLELAQHYIELDTSIPPSHQAKYIMNPNYGTTVKHDINKLLGTRFIQRLEKTTWLSTIVVIPKKNGKFKIYINFRKLNVVTKKDPYPLSFTYEVLYTIVGHDAYSFLDGYFGCH